MNGMFLRYSYSGHCLNSRETRWEYFHNIFFLPQKNDFSLDQKTENLACLERNSFSSFRLVSDENENRHCKIDGVWTRPSLSHLWVRMRQRLVLIFWRELVKSQSRTFILKWELSIRVANFVLFQRKLQHYLKVLSFVKSKVFKRRSFPNFT